MKIKCCGYNIICGAGELKNIHKYVDFASYSSVIVLTEKKIYNLWKNEIRSAIKTEKIIQVDSGECEKNIETAKKIWEQMIAFGADRKSLLINIGGGMITDLGGFAASVYMRGIDYVNCPTSLLAMVDASIGGKNGVNFGEIKNIIGVFGHPKAVIIDINFLQTLEKREYISVFGEIIKHAIIFDKKYFNMLTCCNEIDDKKMLLKIISRSLKIKKYIVEKDIKEKNFRNRLNFGHTVGHAFETVAMNTDAPLLHGEAVALGMVIEAKIAEKMNIISQNEVEKIVKILIKYGFENIVNSITICRIFGDKIDEILKIVKKDKKNQKSVIKMVLPTKIGVCKYNIDVCENQIEEVLKEYFYEKIIKN